MWKPEKTHESVPICAAKDIFAGKKDAKPVGWMSSPDENGPVLVDRATAFRASGG